MRHFGILWGWRVTMLIAASQHVCASPHGRSFGREGRRIRSSDIFHFISDVKYSVSSKNKIKKKKKISCKMKSNCWSFNFMQVFSKNKHVYIVGYFRFIRSYRLFSIIPEDPILTISSISLWHWAAAMWSADELLVSEVWLASWFFNCVPLKGSFSPAVAAVSYLIKWPVCFTRCCESPQCQVKSVDRLFFVMLTPTTLYFQVIGV